MLLGTDAASSTTTLRVCASQRTILAIGDESE